MRILILNWRDITHPWAGGAERHLHELAKRWVRKGHKVVFLCGGYKGALRKEKMDGIEIIRIGGTYSVYLLIPLYYLLRLRGEKFDFVIDTSHGIPFFTPLFTRRLKVLIVHHNHKKLWQTEFSSLISKIGIFLENKVVPLLYKNSLIVTLSQTEKRLLESMGFKKVVAFPPGVDNFLFQNSARKSKFPTILYLGRLRRYKRVDILIRSFPKIKRQIPRVKLIIAGDGQDRARLEFMARAKRIDGDVVFKGFVSEEEKVRLLQESWVLAFPSLVEGWGLVAMEAAACGTPTVGFNVPGIRDAVKDEESGLLADTRQDFIDSIIKILQDRKLRFRLSKGARKWVGQFSWGKTARNFLEVIRRVSEREKSEYDEGYFSSIWRGSYRRKFHPVYDFRVWYILKFLKPKNLLDVGCGTGLIVSNLREKGIEALGVDVSRTAIFKVPTKFRKYCFLGDVRKLKFKDKSFDVVSCIDVLEHITKDDLKKAIYECGRVAKRAVYFDITSLEDIFFIHFDPTHVTKMFSWEWGKLIRENLGEDWKVRRAFILPFLHHCVFVAERRR